MKIRNFGGPSRMAENLKNLGLGWSTFDNTNTIFCDEDKKFKNFQGFKGRGMATILLQ